MKMIVLKLFLICIFKDVNLAEKWTNLAGNQLKNLLCGVHGVFFFFKYWEYTEDNSPNLELKKEAHIANPVRILQKPLSLLTIRKCQLLILAIACQTKVFLKSCSFNPSKRYFLYIGEVIINIQIYKLCFRQGCLVKAFYFVWFPDIVPRFWKVLSQFLW